MQASGQMVLLEAPTPRRSRPARRGRPKQARAGEPHQRRPTLSRHCPVHVVLRVVAAVGSLRRRQAYQAVRAATKVAAQRENFRIVHLSLQRTHIHLLVEAEHRRALSRGMQGFQISVAKQINRMLGRHGRVFSERYHAEIITSPRQARNALSYVLNNWRKHAEDRNPSLAGWTCDWFSSACAFADWADAPVDPPPPAYQPLIVSHPATWLLRAGWKRHGMISCNEVPSSSVRSKD